MVSSDSGSPDDYYGKAFDFLRPKVAGWTKDLFSGFGSAQLDSSQKDLFQTLAIETMLYSSLMKNEEIISSLAGIIRNISTKHAYGSMLDWSKRKV